MKKILLVSTLLFSTLTFSQNYSTAIGIKSGYPGYGSINVKHFLSENLAVDILGGANLGGSSRYFWANCLFEKNKNIVNTSGFNWYYGAGPAVGFWSTGGYYSKNKDKVYSGIWIGVDAVLGIEYTFSAVPLNIAFEGGPTLNLIPYQAIGGMGNIALRFAIQ